MKYIIESDQPITEVYVAVSAENQPPGYYWRGFVITLRKDGVTREKKATHFKDEWIIDDSYEDEIVTHWLRPLPVSPMKEVGEEGNGIYIASKTKHADKWLRLRERGVHFNSTWIDEAGQGESPDLYDLCQRCIKEAVECDAMIVYSEEGDCLKGAFIEMGVALSVNKTVYLVGDVLPKGSVFTHHKNVRISKSIEEAIGNITGNL